jgi:plastocyanin
MKVELKGAETMSRQQSASAMGGKNGPKLMIILGFVVILLLLAATIVGMLLAQSKKVSPSTLSSCVDQTGKTEAVMTYRSDKTFTPSCLKVSSGTKVTYKNDSTGALDVATDPHPIHTGNREISNGQFDLAVGPGKVASVTLTKKGTFGLHNHQNASATATVVVQ